MKQLLLVILQKIIKLFLKTKYKVTTGARNIAPSILPLIIIALIIFAHNSIYFISNDNHHDTYSVYKMQSLFIDYLKNNCPHITMLFYFSDECAE